MHANTNSEFHKVPTLDISDKTQNCYLTKGKKQKHHWHVQG